MNSNVFIYIASNFLLLHLVGLDSEFIMQFNYVLCTIGILTLGIAHGAIDNVLYGAKQRKTNVRFIAWYVFTIAVVAVVWILFPNLAFLLFLVVSAYHFGQSQFAEFDFKPKLLSKFLFVLWGATVLQLMFHFNGPELLASQETHNYNFPVLIHLISYSFEYLVGIILAYVLSFSTIVYYNKLTFNTIFKQSYILILIACSMYLFPSFIAFSLFFVWIHSFKVMTQEFEYCKTQLEVKSVNQFIRLLLPLSICSLLGIAIILIAVFQFEKTHLIPYLLLILLSCVTIPHSFVMERFYGLIFSKD